MIANTGAATRAVTGPVAAIDDIEDFRFIAFDQVSHVMVPAAAPARNRSPTRTGKMPATALNPFNTTRVTAAPRRILPLGRRRRGSKKLTAAKAPT
jgi:hypothetical protein